MIESLTFHALKNLSEDFIMPEHLLDQFTLSDVKTMVGMSICNLSIFERFADYLNWTFIIQNMTMSEAMINRFADYFDWTAMTSHQRLTESVIEDNRDKIYWFGVMKQQLSFEFVEKHRIHIIPFHLFSHVQYSWSEDQLHRYRDTTIAIWMQPNLSEEYIRRNIESVAWNFLSRAPRRWSNEFFIQFFDRWDHDDVVQHAILNETQIELLLEYNVAKYQILSADFIRRHFHRLDFASLAARHTLEPTMIETIQDVLVWSDAERQDFSADVLDFARLGQFSLLCDWNILSARLDIPEAILIANEDKIIWSAVRIEQPSDIFLTRYHQMLSAGYVAVCASEQFLLAHPQYILRGVCYNTRIWTMRIYNRYFEELVRYFDFSPNLSVNFIMNNLHRLDRRTMAQWQRSPRILRLLQ